MKEYKDIRDDQIRIVGAGTVRKPLLRRVWVIVSLILGVVVAGVIVFAVLRLENKKQQELRSPEPALFEPEQKETPVVSGQIGREVDASSEGFVEIKDTLINDIPLKIYIPHNAELSLYIGRLDREDKSIIYAAQAADIRADNGAIVGAFVLQGEPRAWGLSKKGFCASIDGKVTIGVAENSPFFEQATARNGYFFRQYPLVCDGRLVENKPKGKSIRRAICDRGGEIFMVESLTTESFHDFAQALVDLGVAQAVYLVGSTTYGWAVDAKGTKHEFGDDSYYTGRCEMPENINYIVWKKKS